MEGKTKTNMGGIMLIRTFGLKVINNDKKFLTDHEVTDRIAEQIKSVITQVRKESKFWIHPNLQRPSFWFTYSSKFTFCIADIEPLKKGFC